MKRIFIILGFLGGVIIYTTAGGSDLGLLTVYQVVLRIALGGGMIVTAWLGFRFSTIIQKRRHMSSGRIKACIPPKSAA